MPLRPTMIDDLPFIDELDEKLFADHQTYPFRRPALTYYATRVLCGEAVGNDDADLPDVVGLRFFTIFRTGHVAGVMALRPWQDLPPLPNGRYGATDQELFFLGIAPKYRVGGLGRESLQSALREHAQQYPDRTTLTRFKPGCTIYAHMLAQDGFDFYDDKPSGRLIGYRRSADHLIQIPPPQAE